MYAKSRRLTNGKQSRSHGLEGQDAAEAGERSRKRGTFAPQPAERRDPSWLHSFFGLSSGWRIASYSRGTKQDGCIGVRRLRAVRIVTNKIEVLLLCGCSHDLIGLSELRLDLPVGSPLLADKGYMDYQMEDRLLEQEGIHLLALRKSNSRRGRPVEVEASLRKLRKRIETTFSQVSTRLARRIHAVTQSGLESKVMAAFVAYALVGIAS